MGKNLKGKTAAIVALLVVFCYGIYRHSPRGGADGAEAGARRPHQAGARPEGRHAPGAARSTWRKRWARRPTATSSACRKTWTRRASPARRCTSWIRLRIPDQITVSGIPPAKASDVRSVLDGHRLRQLRRHLQPGWQRDADHEAQRHPRRWKRLRWTHSIETISERVNALGVAETTVQQYGLGDNEILVELPGVSDPGQGGRRDPQSTSKLAVYAVVSGPYEQRPGCDDGARRRRSAGRHAGARQHVNARTLPTRSTC